jgi:hypothetical protein
MDVADHGAEAAVALVHLEYGRRVHFESHGAAMTAAQVHDEFLAGRFPCIQSHLNSP